MATITYRDYKKEGAFEVTFHGVTFEHNTPVPIEDEVKHATLIRQAIANPWFEVKENSGAPTEAYERGAQAAAENKGRNVPNALRSQPTDELHYLAGYDDRMKIIIEQREARRAMAEAERAS